MGLGDGQVEIIDNTGSSRVDEALDELFSGEINFSALGGNVLTSYPSSVNSVVIELEAMSAKGYNIDVQRI